MTKMLNSPSKGGIIAMEDKVLLNTREVAHFLDVNEKVVYSLISEKGLPATKVKSEPPKALGVFQILGEKG
jgi:hypothetical protein